MKKNILFVDDEPNILQGLKRMLRSQRNEWDMTFAESGKQALEILLEKPFDAVVSDMRMPEMDGAELLDRVKELYPNIVRFVLSGHSNQELVMRSVGPSHQYLAKPCEPEVLKSKLAGAFALHKLLLSEKISQVVGGMSSLPSLPHIYMKVVEEIQSPDSSIIALGTLIEQDPAMSIKVLQLVNSAYFGISRQITSPAEAANFIGIDILKALVLSEGIFTQFDATTMKAISLDSIQSKSLHTAQSARKIAKAEDCNEVMCDQAFLAGLLSDLGSLVLASNLSQEYLQACEIAKTESIGIEEAEQRVFGTSHAEVAAYLLGLWGIDDDVVTAIAYHHKPEQYPDTKFSALTALYIADSCISPHPHTDIQTQLTSNTLAYFNTIDLAERISEWHFLCTSIDEEAA